MTAESFVAFLAVAALVIVTPGQDTALTIRNALAGGRASGFATAAGVAAGQATWTLITSVGLAALLVAFAPGFIVLRAAGAAYLVFLGLQALWSALRKRPTGEPNARAEQRLTPAKAFRRGLLSNLSNPKMVAFFPSLLPQFIPATHASPWLLPMLGLLFSCMTLTWLAGYTLVVVRIGDYLRRSSIKRAMDAVLGVVLVGLGVRLALERR
jgi:threonine/homoserine/homoserine lactone efflux protein